MKEKINCPVCRKRALDICSTTKGEVWIELKCPHCRNIVTVCCFISKVNQERVKEKLI